MHETFGTDWISILFDIAAVIQAILVKVRAEKGDYRVLSPINVIKAPKFENVVYFMSL